MLGQAGWPVSCVDVWPRVVHCAWRLNRCVVRVSNSSRPSLSGDQLSFESLLVWGLVVLQVPLCLGTSCSPGPSLSGDCHRDIFLKDSQAVIGSVSFSFTFPVPVRRPGCSVALSLSALRTSFASTSEVSCSPVGFHSLVEHRTSTNGMVHTELPNGAAQHTTQHEAHNADNVTSHVQAHFDLRCHVCLHVMFRLTNT